jgi:uncharacterized protein YlxW (UPF0749 family)
MEDQHLGRLLRELPREQARQGFTARVLARLDALNQTPRQMVRWQPRLAAAAATLALALAAAGLLQHSRMEAERAARVARAEQMLRELRAEHGRIKKEIEALPESPVVYLGGDEQTDLVIDMRQVESRDDVRPATYRYDTF